MNINRLIKDLKNGNNPEENLSDYSQLLLASYQKIAYGKYALDLTEKYDLLAEDNSGVITDSLGVVMDITRRVCDGDASQLEQDVLLLNDCRDRMCTVMDDLGKYVHYFEIYEHIFNRLHFKFEDTVQAYDVDTLMDRLMAHISATQDAQSANERIQAILGELPVRMTTAKFMEYLENGCMCYTGARNDMVDDFFARMETCARVPDAGALNPVWDDIYSIACELAAVDTTSLGAEAEKNCSDKIRVAGQLLAKYLGNAMDLLGMINELYTILITTPYVLRADGEDVQICRILKAYMKAVESGDFLDIDEDIMGGLAKVVENQEKYIGEHMLLEDALTIVSEKYAREIDSMMLGGVYKALNMAQRLDGLSMTADISHLDAYFTADDAYVQEKLSHLSDIYSQSFKSCGQMMKRALISLAFENMPVPFDHMDKVAGYMRQCLENCVQSYEKVATAVILDELMGSDLDA